MTRDVIRRTVTNLPPPIVSQNPDVHYLEAYCLEHFGTENLLKSLPKLQARLVTQTGLAAAIVEKLTIGEIAGHFRGTSSAPTESQTGRSKREQTRIARAKELILLEVKRERIVLSMFARHPAHAVAWTNTVRDLWQYWRDRMPVEVPPPEMPDPLPSNYEEAQKAVDDFVRALVNVIDREAGQEERAEGGKLPTDSFAEVREFARNEMKGKTRAATEALCDAGGELPLNELAIKEGVEWQDPIKGFEGLQKKNSKIKKIGWIFSRNSNAGRLKRLSKEPAKDPQKFG